MPDHSHPPMIQVVGVVVEDCGAGCDGRGPQSISEVQDEIICESHQKARVKEEL